MVSANDINTFPANYFSRFGCRASAPVLRHPYFGTRTSAPGLRHPAERHPAERHRTRHSSLTFLSPRCPLHWLVGPTWPNPSSMVKVCPCPICGVPLSVPDGFDLPANSRYKTLVNELSNSVTDEHRRLITEIRSHCFRNHEEYNYSSIFEIAEQFHFICNTVEKDETIFTSTPTDAHIYYTKQLASELVVRSYLTDSWHQLHRVQRSELIEMLQIHVSSWITYSKIYKVSLLNRLQSSRRREYGMITDTPKCREDSHKILLEVVEGIKRFILNLKETDFVEDRTKKEIEGEIRRLLLSTLTTHFPGATHKYFRDNFSTMLAARMVSFCE